MSSEEEWNEENGEDLDNPNPKEEEEDDEVDKLLLEEDEEDKEGNNFVVPDGYLSGSEIEDSQSDH